MVMEREDVEKAAARIDGLVRRTPVIEVEAGLVLKLEGLQHAGSFKPRGAFNRVLAAQEAGSLPAAGVIAASGGNHGLAVAYVARELGLPVEIFVPEVCAPVKVDGLRRLGAHVVQTGAIYSEALHASRERAAATGALEIHAYDHHDVAAGQGTVGLELLEQVERCGGVDTVLVAVGGGGLICGVTAAMDGRAGVVAVEPERIPGMHLALAAGEPVRVEVSGVAADGLGASEVSALSVRTALAHRVRSVLVTDVAIIEARQAMWRDYRVAVEYSGAAALAALRSGAYVPAADERVAVIVCGTNTDPSSLTGAANP
jgi:threonine dehydratase